MNPLTVSCRFVVFANGTLFFSSVGAREEGDYTCYAENQLGKDQMKVRVKIKDGAAVAAPTIHDKHAKVVAVFYGETAALTCRATGEPLPAVTWTSPTNTLILPAARKFQLLANGTLLVQKVQRSDAGNYTCSARNGAGHAQKNVRLDVVVTPPVINSGGKEDAVRVRGAPEERLLMDCVAKGTPPPRVLWVLPGGVVLPAPYHSSRTTVHVNGTLDIRSLKQSDGGQLVCVARNEGGEARLLVHLDVRADAERQTLSGGGDVTLNCPSDGSWQHHVTWFLPRGDALTSGARLSRFFHRPNGSLTISSPSAADAGTYRCVRRQPGGAVEHAVMLEPGGGTGSAVSVLPGDHLLLHCAVGGVPVTLTWTLPSGVVLQRPQRAGRYAVLANGTLAIQQVSVYDRGAYVCRTANRYGSSLHPVTVTVMAVPPRITSAPPSVMHATRGVAVQLNCRAVGVPPPEVAWETPDRMRLAVGAQPRLFGNKYVHPQGALVIQNPTTTDAGLYRCSARSAAGLDATTTFLSVS